MDILIVNNYNAQCPRRKRDIVEAHGDDQESSLDAGSTHQPRTKRPRQEHQQQQQQPQQQEQQQPQQHSSNDST